MKPKRMIAATLLTLAVTACATPQFPAGTYKPSDHPEESRITRFEFAEDGTFAVLYYNGLTAGGAYAISGDEIAFSDAEDSPCYGSPITMTWTAIGDTLTLKAIEDTCTFRPTTDWAGEWTREP
jgi:hypothetical protein